MQKWQRLTAAETIRQIARDKAAEAQNNQPTAENQQNPLLVKSSGFTRYWWPAEQAWDLARLRVKNAKTE